MSTPEEPAAAGTDDAEAVTPAADDPEAVTPAAETPAVAPPAATPDALPAVPPKLSKADKLVAKAERLREQEAARRMAAQQGGSAAPPSRTGWIVAVSVLSVVVAVLAAVVVVLGVNLHHDDSSDNSRTAALKTARAIDDARVAALGAARSGALSFGSYDYRHLDSDISTTVSKLTPSFATQYRRTTTALAQTFAAYKSVSTASVPAAGVVSISTSRATVLVLLDQVIKSTQSTAPKINRNRLKLTLVHTGKRWLIQQIDAV